MTASCQRTQLSLKVRTPGTADASARVRIVRTEGSPCTAGLLFTGSTDATGNLEIHTPACGPMPRVVSRRGSRTVQREIDSCDVHGLEVVLWPASPPWRVELERLPEGWRVRALDRSEPPSSSSP